MHALRWVVRAFLLVLVVAVAAGCAAPQEAGPGGTDAPDVNVTPSGCIEEGQTGSGTGDIVADDACPGAGDGPAVNGTTDG